MGTRNLIAVMVGGAYRVAQYGQWDGYPDGQGVAVLRFLRSAKRQAALAKNARTTRWATKEDFALAKAHGDGWQQRWPEWSRDTAAKILTMVAEQQGMALKNEVDFAGDSLFCEWAYVIDFDADTFEAFMGFNKTPLAPTDRFAQAPRGTRPDGSVNEFYQVRLAAQWPLDALPTKRQFLALLRSVEKERAA